MHAGHFVERHGLVIMIVLGESVVSIGTGASERRLDLEIVAEILLSLVLIAGLWWAYFDCDDERAERAMAAADPGSRGRMAILGYWYAHLVMICGVVLVAAGVKQALATGGSDLSPGALSARSSRCCSGSSGRRWARSPSWSRSGCSWPG